MRRGYAIQPMDVTVVVPTSGRAGYLEVALDSLRGQRTDISHELLVVDDGSTDRTPEVAGRFGARVVRHGERRSLNAARNTGLREARGELIAFVDDDVLRAAGLARRAGGGRAATPRRRGLRRADPAALRGPRAAQLRPRGPADHGARPGSGGPGGRDGVGRELRRQALGGGPHRRVRRVIRPRSRRRGGLADAAARRGRADRLSGRRGTRPPPRGGRFRPRLARARRVPPRPRAHGRATVVTERRPAWRASCATWRARAGTPCGARARRESSWAPTRSGAWWRR